MDKLAEHFEQLAQEQEVAEAAQREAAERIANAESFALLSLLDRLLANEDVKWFLSEMQGLADVEQREALSLRGSETEARQHAHRLDMANTITGWIAKRRAQVANELQPPAK